MNHEAQKSPDGVPVIGILGETGRVLKMTGNLARAAFTGFFRTIPDVLNPETRLVFRHDLSDLV